MCLAFSSYTGRVVGNGLRAQRQNQEVKVRIPNPTLAEVKETLERFNQVRFTIVHTLDPPTPHGADLRHHRNCLFKRNYIFLNSFRGEKKFGMHIVSSLKPSYPHWVLESLILRALKYQRSNLDGGSGRVQ